MGDADGPGQSDSDVDEGRAELPPTLSSDFERILAKQSAHVAAGGLGLCKAKRTADKFVTAYVSSFLLARQFLYVDAAETGVASTYWRSAAPVMASATTTGSAAYDALNSVLVATYRHGNRRIGLWAAADRQPDGSLRCAYTGAVIETADCERLAKADEEHVVPQSWHKGSATHPGRDMHQTFIVTKAANGSRGNRVFGPSAKDAEAKVGGTVQGGTFCPHLNIGAVCRATLHILVAYRRTFHRQFFSDIQLKWLSETAAAEPVTL